VLKADHILLVDLRDEEQEQEQEGATIRRNGAEAASISREEQRPGEVDQLLGDASAD